MLDEDIENKEFHNDRPLSRDPATTRTIELAIDSTRRVLAQAAAENKLPIFRMQCRDLFSHVRRGAVAKDVIVDAAQSMAEEAGLAETHGADVITLVIGEAAEDSSADDESEATDNIVHFEQRGRRGTSAAAKAPPLNGVDLDAELNRLIKLDRIQYEQERIPAAVRLGIRATFLDQLIKEQRLTGRKGQGRQFELLDPEPWPEAVDGEAVLNEAASAIRRHVVMGNDTADTVALWVAHTFLIDAFNFSPRLAITSPEKGCGKTTLLDVIGRLVRRPLLTANVTAPAAFRIIEIASPTLLVDEADTFLGDDHELRGILNSGHRRGGSVTRTIGDDHEPRQFSTFCPCAIAMIGKLPDTLADRSFPIELKRRLPSEAVNRFRADRTEHLDAIARRLARWADDIREKARDADPKVPEGISNRAEDNWRVLLTIADLAGGSWPERARQACDRVKQALVGDSTGIALLEDIKAIFETEKYDGADQIRSKDLVEALAADSTRRWSEYRDGKPLTQRQLAGILRPFNIYPVTVRSPKDAAPAPEGSAHPASDPHGKGYERARFQDAWRRYLGFDQRDPCERAR